MAPRETQLYKQIVQFEKFVRNTGTPGTADRYSIALNNFLSKFDDKDAATEFYRMDIEDYKIFRLKDGVSPRTVNYEVSVVRAFFNYLIDIQGVNFYNPASKVKKLREPQRKRKALTIAEVKALFGACENDTDRLIILLGITSGMRRGEMASLEWSHFDHNNLLINLPAEFTKTQKGRTLPLRKDVSELIKNRVQATPTVLGMTAKTILNRITKVYQRAGLEPKGVHALRHTFATMSLRNGGDLKTIQELLGHSALQTTTLYLQAADTEECRKLIDNLPNVEDV
jgi:integrase